MLWAPRTHHAVLLYRMLGTRQNSSAAAPRRSPESCGTRNVPRNRAGKEQMLWAPRTHHAIISVRDAGDSRFQKLLRGRSAALLQGAAGRGKFRGTARGSVAAPLAPARCVRLPARRWEDDADPSVWLNEHLATGWARQETQGRTARVSQDCGLNSPRNFAPRFGPVF